MKTSKAGVQDSRTLIRHILELSESIFQKTKLRVPPQWLTSNMTVAQLRILLHLYTEGPSRMGAIATSIGIAVSTATGIMDNLVRKGLAMRVSDPEDRRLVICTLSSQGQETMSLMWTIGRSQIEKLLHGLSKEKLEKVNEVAEILLRNVAK